jgi:DNA polymerase III epsilon subunit-like protein
VADGVSERSVLWAIDLETTGLDPERDQIVEIGAVPVIDRRIHLGQAWSSIVRRDPNREHRSSGTVAHGIMPVDQEAGVDGVVALDRLWELVGIGPILFHHAVLDLAFLRALHRRSGRDWVERPVLDTVDLVDRRNRTLRRLGEPELPLQLGRARRAIGLPPAAEHRALDDAVATAELWLALTAHEAAGITR